MYLASLVLFDFGCVTHLYCNNSIELSDDENPKYPK